MLTIGAQVVYQGDIAIETVPTAVEAYSDPIDHFDRAIAPNRVRGIEVGNRQAFLYCGWLAVAYTGRTLLAPSGKRTVTRVWRIGIFHSSPVTFQ